MKLKKTVFILVLMVSLTLIGLKNHGVEAGVYSDNSFSDSFDGAELDVANWQVVNNSSNGISLFSQAGSLRYVDTAGGEEAIVTKDPLTAGTDVTGYSVQFDFLYNTEDWGDSFVFAFNKTTVGKGLDWGKGGYLLGRTTSLQTNNPSDMDDSGAAIAAFGAMTPDIASIGKQQMTFKFVYNTAEKELEMYYDLTGESADLTTLRNTFTFGSLNIEEDYHFSIIGSGKGLFEVDNVVIDYIKDDVTVNYVDEDFETVDLPEELVVINADSFAWGPAKSLNLNHLDESAKILTANKFISDNNVSKALSLDFQIALKELQDGDSVGFIYGLDENSSSLTSNDVSYIYFKNIGGITHIGAVKGDGTTVVQVLNETSLGANLVNEDPMKISLDFNEFNEVKVTIGDDSLEFTGGVQDGYLGFTAEGTASALIDDVNYKTYAYHDQSSGRDIANNFNTGYLNPSDWEIYNFVNTRPGTDLPIFPSAKGIHIADEKLVFDVASESGGFFTVPEYSDFELRFTLSDFDIPVSELNVDGELDGIEVPTTTYVAVSLGHTDVTENPWDVSSLIFQNRDGAAQLYSMNMNNNQVSILNSSLQLNSEENEGETWEFKVVAQGGKVSAWMKRTTDPISLFEGEPMVTYDDVDHFGRIAIAASAGGSFKVDDVSITRLDDELVRPNIEDEIDPADIVDEDDDDDITDEDDIIDDEDKDIVEDDDDSKDNSVLLVTITAVLSIAVGIGAGFFIRFKTSK